MIPKSAAPNTASSPTRGLRLCQVLAHVRHAWFYPIRNQGSCRVCLAQPGGKSGLVSGLPGPTWRKIWVCVGFAGFYLMRDSGLCRVCRVLPDEGFGLVPGLLGPTWREIRARIGFARFYLMRDSGLCRVFGPGVQYAGTLRMGGIVWKCAPGDSPFSALDKTPVKKRSVWNARKGTVPRRAFPDNLRGDGHGS